MSNCLKSINRDTSEITAWMDSARAGMVCGIGECVSLRQAK